GESGSGKSMTCLSILRLVPEPGGRIVGGQILFDGEDLLAKTPDEMRQLRGSRIAMILQDPMASLNPALTVGEQIAETLRLHRGLRGRALDDRIVELLRQVRVSDPERRVHAYPHQMSGGIRQRVAVMYAGRIVETGTVRDMFNRPRHPYTIGLLNCLPTLRRGREPLTAIEGQPPDLAHVPAGCGFAPRCALAEPRCVETRPSLQAVAPDHLVACRRAGETDGAAGRARCAPVAA